MTRHGLAPTRSSAHPHLEANPFAPALPGIRELAGVEVTPTALCAAVVRRLGGRPGWRVEEGDWTAEERERTAALVRERYGTEAWNLKR